MKLGLIAPFSCLATTKQTNYHLLLPHLMDNPAYVSHYQRLRARGDFLMLDNAVAEGLDFTLETLIARARELMVNEIVLPDVMGNAVQTVQKAQAAASIIDPAFNYMAVLQGVNAQQLLACAKAFANLPYITTVGIPRHLLTSLNVGPGDYFRAQAARVIRDQFDDRFEIHLLGTNATYVAELAHYSMSFERNKVRGVDTSAPYNYANANEAIREGVEVNRPAGYFDLAVGDFPEMMLTHNINKVMKWVTP